MHWLFFAFLSAFALSTADALSKRALRRTDEYAIMWVREGYALPFLAFSFLFVPVPRLDVAFYLSVALLVPLEVLALILYVKAIRLSPLSLSVPFMALSPVFILFIAFFTLGERPSSSGILGVALIASGAYLLNASASRHGILGPVKEIWKEKGSVLMIIVALIYSVTSTVGKIAVEHSSPVFFGFFYPLVLTAVLTFVVAWKGRLREVASRPGAFLIIGLFTAIMIVSHFMAISMIDVAYMISIKRTSLLISVLYGKFLFKEENIKERLLGSAVMISGVALITLF
ncbi:MAG: DMT family transporter [Deltaproteobacteria bacterium]|nr:DMT family transporter [Deltaproteobacteria bacterium]